MTTILSLAQDAATELSLAAPGTLFGESVTDEGTKLLRHLTRTCRLLARRLDWQRLRREHTFTTVAAEVQTDTPIAGDLLRLCEGTIWNRTTTWAVEGPLPPDQWQAEKAANVTRVQPAFMIRNAQWLFSPMPTAGQTIAYEYVTKYIGTDDGAATELEAFTADDDVAYFDDELLILGLVWRYRKAEGFDYAEDYREFEMQLANVFKQDGGRQKISMGGSGLGTVPLPPRTPDRLVFT